MSIVDCLVAGSRWYVLIALLVAASGKSMHFGRFRDSLDDAFPMLGHTGALLAALVIVVGEWVAGLLLLAGGACAHIGFILGLSLFVSLTLVVAVVLASGMSVRCNCFGASQQRLTGYDLARNLLFIAAAGYGLSSLSSESSAPALADTIPIIAVATALFLLSIHLREIVTLLQIRAEDL